MIDRWCPALLEGFGRIASHVSTADCGEHRQAAGVIAAGVVI
jgi:hypothetical protein